MSNLISLKKINFYQYILNYLFERHFFEFEIKPCFESRMSPSRLPPHAATQPCSFLTRIYQNDKLRVREIGDRRMSGDRAASWGGVGDKIENESETSSERDFSKAVSFPLPVINLQAGWTRSKRTLPRIPMTFVAQLRDLRCSLPSSEQRFPNHFSFSSSLRFSFFSSTLRLLFLQSIRHEVRNFVFFSERKLTELLTNIRLVRLWYHLWSSHSFPFVSALSPTILSSFLCTNSCRRWMSVAILKWMAAIFPPALRLSPLGDKFCVKRRKLVGSYFSSPLRFWGNGRSSEEWENQLFISWEKFTYSVWNGNFVNIWNLANSRTIFECTMK